MLALLHVLITILSRFDGEQDRYLHGEFLELLNPIIDEFTTDQMLVKLVDGSHTDDLESLFNSIHSQHNKKKVAINTDYWYQIYLCMLWYQTNLKLQVI